jgi:hypothetical protein
MPEFTPGAHIGPADNVRGQIGLIEGVPRSAAGEIGTHHRGRNAIIEPEMPDTIRDLSQRDRVFIYSVNPWQSAQSCGSIGTFTVPALAEEKVLENINGGAFHVAGPLIVPGVPYEIYPRDRGEEGKLIFHKAKKNRGEKNPGMDLAKEIIGDGLRAQIQSNLRLRGVFVSLFMEPKRPEKNATPEALKQWAAWTKLVKDAVKHLLQYCTEKCQDANAHNSRGQFELVRSPELYQMARIVKGTNAQFPWLANVEQATTKSECAFCGQTIPTKALKCPVCGEQIASDADIKAVRDRIKGGTVAA